MSSMPTLLELAYLAPPRSARYKITESVEPVVDGDDDNVVPAGQIHAVVDFEAAGTGGESSAVQPNHYGAFVSGGGAGSPDVEHQAVFAREFVRRRPRPPRG